MVDSNNLNRDYYPFVLEWRRENVGTFEKSWNDWLKFINLEKTMTQRIHDITIEKLHI